MPVWIELKVTNGNAVKLSPHQVAWHTAYWARGGLSFVLVKSLGSRSLFLFRGSEALPLARGGLSEAQGSRFEGLAPCVLGTLFGGLAPCALPCALRVDGGGRGIKNPRPEGRGQVAAHLGKRARLAILVFYYGNRLGKSGPFTELACGALDAPSCFFGRWTKRFVLLVQLS
jgi:hypothetical protein